MPTEQREIDSLLLAVLANRFEAICREMTFTLQRAGRSAILSMGRDFSCALVTRAGELLVSAESLPIHILGLEFQAQAMKELVGELHEGDAYLHNDPYTGNSHHADHTIIVPIFYEGQHLFTACVKAHQADAGNSIPTTYVPRVKDLYEEGALNFPCVKIQDGYKDVDDIIRICRRRLRVPDQWYGDYLAMIGAARIGERRVGEILRKYGAHTIGRFVDAWFDYSEERTVRAIRRLPAGRLTARGQLDPYPNLPDGIPLSITIDIDTERARISIDLTQNPDCVAAGLNLSKATSTASAITGVFNSIDADIPHNAGTFRRIDIQLRENCVVGIPLHPTSCSMATTHVADRVVNMVQAAFAGLGEGYGLAEGGLGMPPGIAVVSGHDWRTGGAPYINQLMLGNAGGPGGPDADGWVNYVMPVAAGLTYRDSVEVAERKYPFHIREQRLLEDTEGAGRRRGAPGSRVVFGPKQDEMTVIHAIDGAAHPPAGVLGGLAGGPAAARRLAPPGNETPVEPVTSMVLERGEEVVSISCGGGGYGNPLDREPARVLKDVQERWISAARALEVYGVVLRGDPGRLAVDEEATRERRAVLTRHRACHRGRRARRRATRGLVAERDALRPRRSE